MRLGDLIERENRIDDRAQLTAFELRDDEPLEAPRERDLFFEIGLEHD